MLRSTITKNSVLSILTYNKRTAESFEIVGPMASEGISNSQVHLNSGSDCGDLMIIEINWVSCCLNDMSLLISEWEATWKRARVDLRPLNVTESRSLDLNMTIPFQCSSPHLTSNMLSFSITIRPNE